MSDLAIRGLKVHGLGPSTSDSGFLWGLRFRVDVEMLLTACPGIRLDRCVVYLKGSPALV